MSGVQASDGGATPHHGGGAEDFVALRSVQPVILAQLPRGVCPGTAETVALTHAVVRASDDDVTIVRTVWSSTFRKPRTQLKPGELLPH